MRRFGLVVLALALTGCGALAAPAGPSPTPSLVSGTNGPFHAEAAPAQVKAGETVHLQLTVTGPIQYQVGCVQTLHIWAEDSRHQQVWAEPVPAIECMAYGSKTLHGGETAGFSADWPTSSRLAPGTYTLRGLFLTVLPLGAGARVRENLPPLAIHISG